MRTGNKLHVEIGTKSGKLRIDHDCVVTMHDADTNDNTFTFHRFPHCLSVSAHCLVLSSLHIVTHTRTVAQVMSFFTPSTCPCSCERFSSPCSPFLLLALPAALLAHPPALKVRRLQPAAHSAQRGYGLV